MNKRLSKRLAVAVFVMLATVGMVYFGIVSAAKFPESADAIAGMVKTCVPSLAGLAGGYLWAETKRGSAARAGGD